MICNMDKKSGLQISVFPREGILHIQFAQVFFYRKYLLVILPFRAFDENFIISSNTIESFQNITGNIVTKFF